MLKGYRTLFFGFATILLGLLGKHAAPEVINVPRQPDTSIS